MFVRKHDILVSGRTIARSTAILSKKNLVKNYNTLHAAEHRREKTCAFKDFVNQKNVVRYQPGTLQDNYITPAYLQRTTKHMYVQYDHNIISG